MQGGMRWNITNHWYMCTMKGDIIEAWFQRWYKNKLVANYKELPCYVVLRFWLEKKPITFEGKDISSIHAIYQIKFNYEYCWKLAKIRKQRILKELDYFKKLCFGDSLMKHVKWDKVSVENV